MLPQEISHYRIIEKLGQGGMGEVYLAYDSVLRRKVAIKLLSSDSVGDEQAKRRLLREAQAAATLDHENICSIYEIGEEEGVSFIVMQYIAGESLSDHLRTTRPGLMESLDTVTQVSRALEEAHSKGVVHRDIKPQNIIITPRGKVKVLDFGLAKIVASDQTSAIDETQSLLTDAGLVIGTAPYMSPEQAKSGAIDRRSDLFSLGAVLYECVTGIPAFTGVSPMDICAKVIHEDPPLPSIQNPRVPAALDRVVLKLLAKKPEERYQSAVDLTIDLQVVAELFAYDEQTPAQTTRQTADASRSGVFLSALPIPIPDLRSAGETSAESASHPSGRIRASRFLMRHLLLALMLAAVAWFAFRRSALVEAPPRESLKTVEVVTWQSTPGEGYSVGAFSHDGKWVAFTSTKGGSKNIWIKQAAAGDAEPSTRDEFTNANPIWSPDGNEIAFISMRDGQLDIWRKPPFGGSPKLLAKLTPNEGNIRLVRWSNNGATVYYESNRDLFAINVDSGRTSQLTHLDTANVVSFSLSTSPDERHLAYIARGDGESRILYVAPLRGGTARPIARLSRSARNTVWHPDGERVFFSSDIDGTFQVFAADMHANEPVQITFDEKDNMVLDVSADGARVLCGSSREESDIWRVNVAKAEESPVASDISAEFWPRVSPDNRTVAYQAVRNLSEGNKILRSSILVQPVDSSTQSSVLIENAALVKWSPDGTRLAFLRISDNEPKLWSINAAGGEEKQLTSGSVFIAGYSMLPYQRLEASEFDWSPDGRKVVYCSERTGTSNLWEADSIGSSDRQLTDNSDSNVVMRCPLWSPDGTRLAYYSRPWRIDADDKTSYRVWIREKATGIQKPVFESNSFLRIIGWMPAGEELILATLKGKIGIAKPTEISLLRVSVTTGVQRLLATLQATYLYNIELASDGRTLAFSSHREGKDDLWTLSVTGNAVRKLTGNSDGRLYFSSLGWSPDCSAIYYGKQVRYSQLWMITNFK